MVWRKKLLPPEQLLIAPWIWSMNLRRIIFSLWSGVMLFMNRNTFLVLQSPAQCAKAQIDIAREFNAHAVAHGATGKGNDQCRFELTFSALAPDLKILAPWRDASFREQFPGRKEMIEYCKTHKIDVEASASKPYSMDRNLWHISYEAGILEDPWFDPTTQTTGKCTN